MHFHLTYPFSSSKPNTALKTHPISLDEIEKPSSDGAAGQNRINFSYTTTNKKYYSHENKLNSWKKRNKRQRIVLLTMEPIEESEAQVGDVFQYNKKSMQYNMTNPIVSKFAIIIYFYPIFRTFPNHQCHVITIHLCSPTLCQHLIVKYRAMTC